MKILYISKSTASIFCGSGVQIVAEINMWSKNGHQVDFISKNPIKKDISCLGKVISPDYHLNYDEIIEKAIEEDSKNNYDIIICRGFDLNLELFNKNEKIFKEKCFSYILEKPDHYVEILELYKNAKFIKCQSDLHKEKILKLDSSLENKIIVQYPLVENISLEKNGFEYDIIYFGKVAKYWGNVEYLEFLNQNNNLRGCIVASQYLKDLGKGILKFKKLIRCPNITSFPEMSRSEVFRILNKSKFSFCLRDKEIDNDDNFHVSSKLLDSIQLNIPVITRRCKINEQILGKDYVFCDDYSNILETMEKINNIENVYANSNISRSNPDVAYKLIMDKINV